MHVGQIYKLVNAVTQQIGRLDIRTGHVYKIVNGHEVLFGFIDINRGGEVLACNPTRRIFTPVGKADLQGYVYINDWEPGDFYQPQVRIGVYYGGNGDFCMFGRNGNEVFLGTVVGDEPMIMRAGAGLLLLYVNDYVSPKRAGFQSWA
jgi:hypothetical protein